MGPCRKEDAISRRTRDLQIRRLIRRAAAKLPTGRKTPMLRRRLAISNRGHGRTRPVPLAKFFRKNGRIVEIHHVITGAQRSCVAISKKVSDAKKKQVETVQSAVENFDKKEVIVHILLVGICESVFRDKTCCD